MGKLVTGYAAARADLALQAVSGRVGLGRRYFDLREGLRARLERPALERYREQGLLFIHVPKCGGSSIEKAIGTFHGHRSAVYFREADPALFARLHKAALVRNPFDRLVSGFHYLKNHTTAPRDQAWAQDMLGDVPDFGAFLGRLGEPGYRRRVLTWLHFIPQWYFLCDRDGRLLVDHVGRLEAFDAFADHIEGRLGVAIGRLQEKRSRRGDYRGYFTAGSTRLVREMYDRDFALFGYPPEPA